MYLSLCLFSSVLLRLLGNCYGEDAVDHGKEFAVNENVRASILVHGKDCSPGVEETSVVLVHFATTVDGLAVYSTREQPTPASIDMGSVPEGSGWEEAMIGMCPGELRRIIVSPTAGEANQAVEQHETVTEVELVRIDSHHHHEEEHMDSFAAMDENQDDVISWEEMERHVKQHHVDYAVDNEPIETIVSEIFQEEDTNKDGHISEEEYYRQSQAEPSHHSEL